MPVIQSARFIQPHSLHSVIIEMRCDHEGVAGNARVSARANTVTFELTEVAGVKDGPIGDALIEYLKVASKAPSGLLPAAIQHAIAKGY